MGTGGRGQKFNNTEVSNGLLLCNSLLLSTVTYLSYYCNHICSHKP